MHFSLLAPSAETRCLPLTELIRQGFRVNGIATEGISHFVWQRCHGESTPGCCAMLQVEPFRSNSLSPLPLHKKFDRSDGITTPAGR